MSAATAALVSAWATVFSAVGTVGALLVAMRLLRHERNARREQEQHEARATAELVACWWTGVERLDPTEADKHRGAVTAFAVRATVRNGASEPIYDVIVTMPEGAASDVDPGDLDLLRPQTEVEVMILHRRHPNPGGSDPAPFSGIPSVAFTDGRGRRWRRDHDGRLKVDEAPVLPRWQRIQVSGQRQDAWFDTWAENPFSRDRE